MHLENLLFILLIVMAGLFRLLASKAGQTKKRLQNPDQRSTTSPQLGEPPTRAPVESDEKRIRKFLEALGQPATSRPPPPVVPRTNIPPRPLAPVQPPRIPTARNILTDRRRPVVETTKSPEPLAFGLREAPPLPKLPTLVKPSVETYATAADSKTKLARTGVDIATFLRSPAGLRNAIVLREIFGPPRGVQRLEEMRDSYFPI
jgi:hypothetical protein